MIDPRSPDPQRLVVRLILALASAVAFFSAGKVTKDLQGGYGNSSWCAHLSGVDESLFCASMTGSHRSHAVQEWIRAERECAWRQRSATKNDLSTYYTSSDLPSDLVFAASAPGIEDPLKGSIWSPDVLTIENATVTHCRVPVGDSVWTMERVGDFIGTGGAGLGSWHHAFYSDVGFFSREVKEGELYFTAFQFVPVNAATGERLGYPPARIHHMHVAADQLRRLTKEPPYNTFYAREGIFLFDVHGDRQCHASLGGVDCLMNAMPTGFGVKSSDVLETFVSINDARPSDSEPLHLRMDWAFRWTRAERRPMVRMVNEFESISGIPPYDFDFGTYDFDFDPARTTPTEYMIWGGITPPFDVHLMVLFLHSHHVYTEDMWFIAGPPKSAGLDMPPLLMPKSNQPMNLTKHNYSITGVKSKILRTLETSTGRLHCVMNKDHRFEEVGGKLYPRFALQHCQPITLHAGEILTGISFHSFQGPHKISEYTHVFAHSSLYSYGVALHPEEVTQSATEFLAGASPWNVDFFSEAT